MDILTDDQLAQHGVEVFHHFGGGVYAKECLIPAGTMLVQHSHPYAHLSVLASGRAVVDAGGVKREIEGPTCITIPSGAVHSVQALTPVVWFCCHATDDTNPETVDRTVLHA